MTLSQFDLFEAYQRLKISPKVYTFVDSKADKMQQRFAAIDLRAQYNQLKVLAAMQECQVSEACMTGTTGYGYNDLGRDKLEEVYAKVFKAEAALVRPQITCGTHALSVALSAMLRPGDELLSVTGKPYDTLEEVIGIRPSKGSLKEYGVTYRQVDLLPGGAPNYSGIKNAINSKTRVIAIQRSKGYETRPTLPVKLIGEIIGFIRLIKPGVVVMVDNCYGEFVDVEEPSEVGADLVVGSLIKNPGGGLAPTGGYIVGKRPYIDYCAARLTSPGLGKEVGASLGMNQAFFQGLFLAPTVVAGALKGAMLAANVYEELGFPVMPNGKAQYHDIIQTITLGSAEAVIEFCKGIQEASPVDSHVSPEPWAMPGYDSEVIMAAGAFVSGSSIELSADGPIKEPYVVYFQGGLTFEHAKVGIMRSLQRLVDAKLAEFPKPPKKLTLMDIIEDEQKEREKEEKKKEEQKKNEQNKKRQRKKK